MDDLGESHQLGIVHAIQQQHLQEAKMILAQNSVQGADEIAKGVADRLQAIGIEVLAEYNKAITDGKELDSDWCKDLASKRMHGALERLKFQIEIISTVVPFYSPRFMSLFDLLRYSTRDLADKFSKIIRAETDVLSPERRGKVRTEWQSSLWDLGGELSAEVCNNFQNDEASVIAQVDHLRRSFQSSASEKLQEMRERIQREIEPQISISSGNRATWKWERIIIGTYVSGYCLYVIVAALSTYNSLPLNMWWGYVSFQFFYATFWPILLLLNLVGIHW